MAQAAEFQNETVNEIVRKYEPIWSTYHASALLGWDLEVYMPPMGGAHRGVALAHLALMAQKMTLELGPLVAKAEREGSLDDRASGVLRVIKRDLHYFERVPPRLIEEIQRTATEAAVVWREAKRKADFNSFRPYLEKIVGLKREEAEKLGYQGHRYNALLDQFEEGLTVADVDATFSRLSGDLKRILEKVMAEKRFSKPSQLATVAYEESGMRGVNAKVVEMLGMPKDRFRMDVSAHPFTIGIARDDVRITTRYEGKDFKATMFSTVHETGHAIYELQASEGFVRTPIDRSASYAIHESQSRFWENAVGRSRQFTHLMMPTLKQNLPFLSAYDEEAVFQYFNAVKPSKIRVDADELTYNFHIMLRYEIEKKLIAGDASVSELPGIWGDSMERYLGLRPENDGEGVLQDIHWSQGSMGYFPTYAMGNVLVGVILKAIGNDFGGMVERGEFMKLRGWLKEKIHRHGAIYPPKELLKKSFGTGYDPAPLVEYLEKKLVQ